MMCDHHICKMYIVQYCSYCWSCVVVNLGKVGTKVRMRSSLLLTLSMLTIATLLMMSSHHVCKMFVVHSAHVVFFSI